MSPSAGIEDLREKREGILKQIADEESEKVKIQQELQQLTKRMAAINESLARKVGEGDAAVTAVGWQSSCRILLLVVGRLFCRQPLIAKLALYCCRLTPRMSMTRSYKRQRQPISRFLKAHRPC